MTNRKDVQVDHIIPPSRLAKKRRTLFGRVKHRNILTDAMNTYVNTVAICPECNKKKSDKVDYRIARGYAMKTVEVALINVQNFIIFALGLLLKGIYFAIKYVLKALLIPLKGNRPWYVKLAVIAIYVLASLVLWKQLF